jgi:hypothetical protein
MDHCNTRGVGDGLPLIGLAVGVISLMTVMARLAEHPASISSIRAERLVNPVATAPFMTSRDRHGDQGAGGSVASDPVASRNCDRQSDARLDRRDAAAMARWYLLTRPGREETRTDLWINAPASIGSTSVLRRSLLQPLLHATFEAGVAHVGATASTRDPRVFLMDAAIQIHAPASAPAPRRRSAPPHLHGVDWAGSHPWLPAVPGTGFMTDWS